MSRTAQIKAHFVIEAGKTGKKQWVRTLFPLFPCCLVSSLAIIIFDPDSRHSERVILTLLTVKIDQ